MVAYEERGGVWFMVELFMLEAWWWWGRACMFSVVLQYYTLCAGWLDKRLASTDSLKPTLLSLVSSPGPAKIAANIPKHVWLLFDPVFIIF